MPFSYLEKSVFKQGYQLVAGIDEAGRGCLAGPVAAAIVIVKKGNFSWLRKFPKVKDSKLLSKKQREEIFGIIKNEPMVNWRVSFVWPRVIDRINIWQATLLAWRRCLKKLNCQPDFLFLDGKFDLFGNRCEKSIPSVPYQQPVVGGDQKIFLLSLASIIAKVCRDRLMERLDQKYPQYGFVQHKGYGTKLHFERLKKFGPCEIHRKSFRPVFENLSFQEKVYYLVSQIPRGQIMTYQEIAQKIGHPRAYRAVGNALNKNIDPQVPCHRVIRANGQMGGYNQGSQIKKKLLKREGALKKLRPKFN
jgi:ribonuclease HII